MASSFWAKGGARGTLHHYTETLVAFEFDDGRTPKPDSLLFVGGLGDGLATTSYLADLSAGLASTSWSLFSLTLSSSYAQWGSGHLDRDANEIAQCVKYVQEVKSSHPTGKVVLMGHSTGSQDVLHYLYRSNPLSGVPAFDEGLEHIVRPAVDGAILQAPVSDREVIQMLVQGGWNGKSPQEMKAVFDQLLSTSREVQLQDPSYDKLLPGWALHQLGYPKGIPITARRFLSLNTIESDDDLFSSDLSDERLQQTFGMIKKSNLLRGRLLVLSSGADQSVPEWILKTDLVERWRGAAEEGSGSDIWDEGSGVIQNASHALSNDDQTEQRGELVRRVLGYLERILQR